jgi:riboflavin synthase
MFTGLIEVVGEIKSIKPIGGDKRLLINCPNGFLDDCKLGDSIAVSGVCLTAVSFNDNEFSADVSNETLSLTSLAQLALGSKVNLEKALLASSRLGGHIVSGHVDGLGVLDSIEEDGRSLKLSFSMPNDLAHYIAKKGSITIDGISLTVNSVENSHFSVNIVPHTADKTTLSEIKIGQKVNLEIDVIARYLERMLTKVGTEDSTANAKNATMLGLLEANGFH